VSQKENYRALLRECKFLCGVRVFIIIVFLVDEIIYILFLLFGVDY